MGEGEWRGGRSQVGWGRKVQGGNEHKDFFGRDGMSKEGFHSKDKGVFWLNMRN